MLDKFIIIYSIIQTFLMPVIFRSTDIPHFVSMVVYHDKERDYISVELKNSISKKLKEVIESGILVEISYEIEQIRKLKKKKDVIESKIVTKGLSYDMVNKKYQVISNNEKKEFVNFEECQNFWSILTKVPLSLEKIENGEQYFYQVTAKLGKVKSISDLEVNLMNYWANQIPIIESKVIRR
ncbi:MAG: DUF4390 domain-containing protein [bacterium]|nr:DUF4390 domain-containing protein [bacterium]